MKSNSSNKNNSRALVVVQGKEVKVGNLNSWRGLVATFAAYQDVRESSRKLYIRTLSQFFLWVEKENLAIPTLALPDIKNYKTYLEEQNLSSLTISSYLTAVRKFYEWAAAEKLYQNIAKGIKTPARKQRFRKQHLTEEKCTELLDYFQHLSLRDYAIVNLMLRTGLRTIEVVRADIQDITFEQGRRILKVWGKGRDRDSKDDECVVLSDKAYEPIKNYLAVARKGAKAGEPLFTSMSHQNYGKRLTTMTISSLCKNGLRAIGLDGKEFTAHSLRHTTAVTILKQHGQITDVQSVLRHSSPVTSQIYTESIKREMRLQDAPELRIDNAF